MGMDVCGKKPTSKVGMYFGRPAWARHPLADCVLALAPLEASGCRDWHTNDGDGLEAAQSVKLADKLDALIESGAVASYIEKFGEQVQVLGWPRRDLQPGPNFGSRSNLMPCDSWRLRCCATVTQVENMQSMNCENFASRMRSSTDQSVSNWRAVGSRRTTTDPP